MRLTLKSTQFHLDTGAVAMLMQSRFGGMFYLNTTEAALYARVPVVGGEYGNAELLAEAQYLTSSVEIFTATTGMSADEYPEGGFTVVLAAATSATPVSS